MIEMIASLPHYRDHLAPVWDALPKSVKGPGGAALVAGHRDVLEARKRGHKRVALLEHGIGQTYSNRHSSYPGGAGRDAVTLFLSPNEHAASRDRAAYPDALVEVVGSPRLEALPTRQAGPPLVAISFHWECRVAPETRSSFVHYLPVLHELAAAFPLVGHGHPRAQAELAKFYRRLGIPFEPSFDEICERADLYICDNSSTLFEFAATGRPVVVLNAPWYRRDVNHGLRFWDAADVGMQVDDPADLVKTVWLAVTDPYEQQAKRERALDLAYAFRSGATQRAVDALMWELQ